MPPAADAVESNNGIKGARPTPLLQPSILVVQGRFCENLFIFMENLNSRTQPHGHKKKRRAESEMSQISLKNFLLDFQRILFFGLDEILFFSIVLAYLMA